VFSLGEGYGIDDATFLDVLNGSVLQSPVLAAYGEKIATNGFEPAGFALKLGAKDMKLMVEAGEARTLPMPLANLLRYRFVAALAQGKAEVDWSALARTSTRPEAA
jgi:3-hydroxyisobutyrate dehydrogenase-like beta-hydroxyacid dehydrogenase